MSMFLFDSREKRNSALAYAVQVVISPVLISLITFYVQWEELGNRTTTILFLGLAAFPLLFLMIGYLYENLRFPSFAGIFVIGMTLGITNFWWDEVSADLRF